MSLCITISSIDTLSLLSVKTRRTEKRKKYVTVRHYFFNRYIARVPDQNNVCLLYIMLEKHHSGRKPSKFSLLSIKTGRTEKRKKKSHCASLFLQ